MSYVVCMVTAKSDLPHIRCVGYRRRSSRQNWRLLFCLISALVFAARPVLAINFARDKSAGNTSSVQEEKGQAAQQAFEAAEKLKAEGTPASLASAVEKYQQALELWRELKDQRSEAMTLNNMASAYYEAGDKVKALNYYKQALAIYRAVGDRSSESKTLNNIGYVYFSISDYPKALESFNQALPIERAVSDRPTEALTLDGIGRVYESQGDHQKALDNYNLALPIHHAVGNRSAEAETLNNIGLVYASQGDKEKALECYNHALPIDLAIGDQSGEATTLSNIASVYESKGDWPKSLEYYNQALSASRAVANHSGEAATLNHIGSVYDAQGERKKALEYYQQALPAYRAAGNRSGEATALNNIGSVYDSQGEEQKALDYFNQALSIERAVGESGKEARTLSNMGHVYNSRGENQTALDYYNQALPIERAAGDRSAEAETLNNIGGVHFSLGSTHKALDYYEQALSVERARGDRDREGRTLNNVGGVHFSVGETQQALEYYHEALDISRAFGNRSDEAATLNNIGAVYDVLWEKQKALDHYNQALEIRQAIGDERGVGTILNNIGAVYDSLGEKDKALDEYKRVLLIRQSFDDRAGEATTLTNMGLVYYSQGDWQGALEYYERALPLHRKAGNRSGEAQTLNNIGLVYQSKRDLQTALGYYNQSLPIEHDLGDHSREAITLDNIGSVYDSQGEFKRALDYYDQALTISRAVGERAVEAATLLNIAVVNIRTDQPRDARRQLEEALAIIESLRNKVLSHELRTSFFASQTGYYDIYVDLLMQMHRRDPNAGYDRQAFEASEKGNARSLLDLLNEAGAHIHRGADPRLLERETTIHQQLNAVALRRTKLLNQPETAQKLSEIDQQLRDLESQNQQVEAEIRQNSPQYAALTQPRPASVAETQQQILDPDTVLLEFALGEERSYLWLVTSTTFASFELPRRPDIEQASQRAYSLLTARVQRRVQADKDYETAAAALSNLLLSQVAPQLGHHRLVIVADGALNYIPFSALPAPASSSTPHTRYAPLLVDHEVVQLPSASVLGLLRREIAGRPIPPKEVFVVADPVFSARDRRVKPPELQQGSTLLAHTTKDDVVAPAEVETNQMARLQADVGLERGDDSWPRLEGTRDEAQSILALAPAGSKMALDFEASRAIATSSELSQYRYLHFATHGTVDSQHPELSGLVLSMVNQYGEPVNGFLRLQDIYNLNLPVELVVLSACETGIGKEVRGEGLMGLTRGFMYAGAPRVVVSLWKVKDTPTAELMGKFYEGMLRQKLRPAAALRAAQLAMWQDPRWRAPYYWAAFVLQGEWN